MCGKCKILDISVSRFLSRAFEGLLQDTVCIGLHISSYERWEKPVVSQTVSNLSLPCLRYTFRTVHGRGFKIYCRTEPRNIVTRPCF